MHKHICTSKLCMCVSLLSPGNAAGEQKMWPGTVLAPRAVWQSSSYQINLAYPGSRKNVYISVLGLLLQQWEPKRAVKAPPYPKPCCTGSFTASKSARADIFKYFPLKMVWKAVHKGGGKLCCWFFKGSILLKLALFQIRGYNSFKTAIQIFCLSVLAFCYVYLFHFNILHNSYCNRHSSCCSNL